MEQRAAVGHQAMVGGRAGEQRRVVLVDDDARSREQVRRLVAMSGRKIELVELTTAECAADYVRRCVVDLTVLHSSMSASTGIEGCRLLRGSGSASPLVYASHQFTPELERLAREAGASHVLLKPIDWSNLLGVTATEAATETNARNQLVADHIGCARNIARRIARQYARALDPEDIEGPAMVGLCEAAARFDRTRPEPFIAFAEQRIRGAILDELRRLGTHGRVVHKRQRRISVARSVITQSGHEPTDDRVAAHLNLSVTAIRSAGERTIRVTGDEAAMIPCPNASPEARVECSQFLVKLARARAVLPARQAAIIRLRYDLGFSLAQIARTLDLTLGRVRHVHAVGISKLRQALRDDDAGGDEPPLRESFPYAALGELEALPVGDAVEPTVRPGSVGRL